MSTITVPEDGRAVSNTDIRILLADDHPIVRLGLKTLLGAQQDLEVVGEVADGRELLPKVQELDPDILLLDQRMNIGGATPLTNLQAANLRTRTIVMATAHDQNQFVEAMRLGASGILLKQSAPDMIVNCIHKVYDGEIWLDSSTTAAVVRQFSSGRFDNGFNSPPRGQQDRKPLSPREREIVALVAQGFKNREIADSIFLSEQTVKNHLHNIFDKLQVSDRLELALYAVHTGIYTTPVSAPKMPAQKSEETPLSSGKARPAGAF